MVSPRSPGHAERERVIVVIERQTGDRAAHRGARQISSKDELCSGGEFQDDFAWVGVAEVADPLKSARRELSALGFSVSNAKSPNVAIAIFDPRIACRWSRMSLLDSAINRSRKIYDLGATSRMPLDVSPSSCGYSLGMDNSTIVRDARSLIGLAGFEPAGGWPEISPHPSLDRGFLVLTSQRVRRRYHRPLHRNIGQKY